MTPPAPLAVPPELQRGAHRSREEWFESALFAIDLLTRTLGRSDLAGVEVLDVGCGTKIVKALLDHELPIGHYAGVDASSEVIDWLQANVSDPRFEFHHLDAHNAMYNPTGEDLATFELLPVGAVASTSSASSRSSPTWRRTTSRRCCGCCVVTPGQMACCSSPCSSTTLTNRPRRFAIA